jgi:putative hydroxymethylpyrimidine transport system ATP-binding protein
MLQSASPSPEILVSGIAHLGNRLLFDCLTLQMRPGEWTALLGPSGSGKSTLLRIIAGLPVAAKFDGQVKADDQLGLSGRIGYMAQQDLLLDWATVRDNIALGSRLRGEPCPLDRISDIIYAVGLNDKSEKRPCELSGGQRQRVALARTLLEDRPVILLDEPFSALDARTRVDMQDLAASQLFGRTVLLVTHDPGEAVRLCNRIYLLQSQSLVSADALNGPFPKSVDDGDALALQAKLLMQIRSGT